MDTSIQSRDDLEQKKINAGVSGERAMETVGVYLKRERESKNLSLREVARITKISERYLDCLEKDDYEKIPQGPYVKGYISTYSRLIGGNTEQALKLYDSLNKKKNQPAETQPQIPQVKGWKASIATAFTSIFESLDRRKTIRQGDPPEKIETNVQLQRTASLIEKRKASLEAARSRETEKQPPAKVAESTGTSVLIPFKSFAPPSKTSASFMKPVSPVKGAGITLKTAIVSVQRKLLDFLGAVAPFSGSLFSKARSTKWPLCPRTLLVACALLLVGGTVLVFFGFGVYHVFLFDKHAPMPIQRQALTDKDSAPQPPLASTASGLGVLPHKAPRLKKPVSTPPPENNVEIPASRLTLPAETVAPSRSVAVKESPLPQESKATATESAAESTRPTDAKVSVLKATICSTIKDRMPTDTAATFPLSVERIYVWNLIQAKQYPTAIRHIYYHEGQIVSQVDLNVRSPFWRTWSFKKIDEDRYRGKWQVDITTIDGKVLRRLYFEVN
jgi:hypothetical protein